VLSEIKLSMVPVNVSASTFVVATNDFINQLYVMVLGCAPSEFDLP